MFEICFGEEISKNKEIPYLWAGPGSALKLNGSKVLLS